MRPVRSCYVASCANPKAYTQSTMFKSLTESHGSESRVRGRLAHRISDLLSRSFRLPILENCDRQNRTIDYCVDQKTAVRRHIELGSASVDIQPTPID